MLQEIKDKNVKIAEFPVSVVSEVITSVEGQINVAAIAYASTSGPACVCLIRPDTVKSQFMVSFDIQSLTSAPANLWTVFVSTDEGAIPVDGSAAGSGVQCVVVGADYDSSKTILTRRLNVVVPYIKTTSTNVQRVFIGFGGPPGAITADYIMHARIYHREERFFQPVK